MSMQSQQVEVTEPIEIVFAEGLIGIPRARRFRLLSRENSEVRILECLDIANFRLPVVDPYLADPKYRPDVSQRVMEALGFHEEDPILYLAITVVNDDGSFANLRAPLVINTSNCAGMQVILDHPDYNVQAPLEGLKLTTT